VQLETAWPLCGSFHSSQEAGNRQYRAIRRADKVRLLASVRRRPFIIPRGWLKAERNIGFPTTVSACALNVEGTFDRRVRRPETRRRCGWWAAGLHAYAAPSSSNAADHDLVWRTAAPAHHAILVRPARAASRERINQSRDCEPEPYCGQSIKPCACWENESARRRSPGRRNALRQGGRGPRNKA
jgi:hypothetical protein